MRERVIEDLLYHCPEEFFSEPLKVIDRQRWVEGRRLDLLFEDLNGHLLLVEVKAGEILREHVGQAGEYFGLLRNCFPDRSTRVALLGTAISPERKCFLEAFGVEVRIISEQFLLDVASRHGIDPDMGIPKERKAEDIKQKIQRPFLDRTPVTDEASYLGLLDEITSNEATKERLMAIYAIAKKSPYLKITFSKYGSAEVSICPPHQKSVKMFKVGPWFRLSPPDGVITIYWKSMRKAFPCDKLQSFAELVDRLLSRHKSDVFLDPNQKEGTFDIIRPAELDGSKFSMFLEGLENLARELGFDGVSK